MESCGMQLAKYLLFGFNLIFAISGLTVLIAGAVVLSGIDEYRTFMESKIVGPPIILIIVGLIIFVIAFLGCWGALRENSSMLIAYAVLLLIIFILEFAVGITAAVAKEQFGDAMKQAMTDSTKNYEKAKLSRNAWDKMQQEMECCGVVEAGNWLGILDEGVMVPSSCCKMMGTSNCNNRSLNSEAFYMEGCYDKLKMKVKNGALALAGIGIGIAFIEIAGIVLALLLVHSIRKSSEKS